MLQNVARKHQHENKAGEESEIYVEIIKERLYRRGLWGRLT